MARQKHKHTEDEQEDIQGTRVYLPKHAKAYADALSQRQQWQADENNLRSKLMEVMEAEKVSEYYLKGRRIKVENPKDEDGNTERPEKTAKQVEAFA